MIKDIMEGLALLATLPADGRDANWMEQGKCARHPDPDMWFAPIEYDSPRYAHLAGQARLEARRRDREHAKEICRACPVRGECLRYSLENGMGKWGMAGMWGGLNESERTKLRNMLAAKEVAA